MRSLSNLRLAAAFASMAVASNAAVASVAEYNATVAAVKAYKGTQKNFNTLSARQRKKAAKASRRNR